jgi:hypothetical protein
VSDTLRQHLIEALQDILGCAADHRHSDALAGGVLRLYLTELRQIVELMRDASVIHNDKELRIALRRISRLMCESPKNPRIELLAVLIEEYEKKRYPMFNTRRAAPSAPDETALGSPGVSD